MVFAFRGFHFPVNPQQLEIRDGGRVRTQSLARDGFHLDELPVQPVAVSGTGVFTGECAARDFERLRAEFLKGGRGVLLLGAYRSMDAVFRSLVCTGRQGDSVGYAFEFVEFPVEKTAAEKVTHTVSQGETLWDIAAQYGIAVEQLMALNPSLPAPEEVAAGEEVYLC